MLPARPFPSFVAIQGNPGPQQAASNVRQPTSRKGSFGKCHLQRGGRCLLAEGLRLLIVLHRGTDESG